MSIEVYQTRPGAPSASPTPRQSLQTPARQPPSPSEPSGGGFSLENDRYLHSKVTLDWCVIATEAGARSD